MNRGLSLFVILCRVVVRTANVLPQLAERPLRQPFDTPLGVCACFVRMTVADQPIGVFVRSVEECLQELCPPGMTFRKLEWPVVL